MAALHEKETSMSDPFLDNVEGIGLLEAEMKQLRLENRELRLANTNLRARLALATPSASVDGEMNQAHFSSGIAEHPVTNSEAHGRASPRNASDAGTTHSSVVAGVSQTETTAAPSHRRAPAAPSPVISSVTAPQVSAARLREAAQQVRKELQGELETHRKAVATEKAEKEQLKREFELFVSTTCEREAAYRLVHAQLYREMEEQRELVRSAQAQLEEQRVQSVEMRRTLEAAVAAAAARAGAAAQRDDADGGSSSLADAAADRDNAAPSKKRRRTAKAPSRVPAPRQAMERLPKDLNWTELAGGTAPAETALPDSETVSATEASLPDSNEPRTLKILPGGASLRRQPTVQSMKRLREPMSRASLPASPSFARVPSHGLTHAGLHVPVAPVFAKTPSSAAAGSTGASATNDNERHSTSAASSTTSMAAPSPLVSATASGAAASATVDALWRLLAHHTEATHGFLPLWQHLVVLRGDDRITVLTMLVSLIVHLLGPHGSSAAAFKQGPHAACASLPPAFVSQPSSITVVATAVRLLTVQLEEAAHQQRGKAEAGQQANVLLSSLFYRMCVATLCRWQVADCAAEALEHWATAVNHLYGFQPDLLRLMQYTNTTAAYHRTRLHRSWISYTAQSIFAHCLTASSPTAEAAARWRELCDSVGWSTHALPLERIETAAARCVATSRVGHGPLTASCAEEALLSLRLVVLYLGFDHMECVAKLLEQPGVLPMTITKEIYAELVSLAVCDGVPFRTQDALHHALRLLKEYLQEVAPERCTSAEHFASAPRRSHVLAALALLRVSDKSVVVGEAASASSASTGSASGGAVTAAREVVEAGRSVVLKWLRAQKVALAMVRQSPALGADRLLLLRDTQLGRALLSEVVD